MIKKISKRCCKASGLLRRLSLSHGGKTSAAAGECSSTASFDTDSSTSCSSFSVRFESLKATTPSSLLGVGNSDHQEEDQIYYEDSYTAEADDTTIITEDDAALLPGCEDDEEEVASYKNDLPPLLSSSEFAAAARKVRFNLFATQFYECACSSADDVVYDLQQAWYSGLDIRNFQSDIVRDVHDIKDKEEKSDDTYERVLRDVYLACCALKATATELTDDDDSHRCSLLPHLSNLQRERFNKCIHHEPAAYLGLDRHVVSSVARNRQCRKRNMFKTVLTKQRQTDTTPEELRRQAENISRPAKLFAYTLAQIQVQVGDDVVDQMIKAFIVEACCLE